MSLPQSQPTIIYPNKIHANDPIQLDLTSFSTCSSPKRMWKRPRPRNRMELPSARNMLVSTWSRGGHSGSRILLKTEGLTSATFAYVSKRKVTHTPKMLIINPLAILSGGNLSYCWLFPINSDFPSGQSHCMWSGPPHVKQPEYNCLVDIHAQFSVIAVNQ